MKLRRDLALLFAFSLFTLLPLTAPGYFTFAHDARHSVYFLQMFDQTWRDGAWYPRWAADMVFGYGYPLWVILPPLPFFLGEAFHLVGFDLVTSVKMVDGLALFFSMLAMYLFSSRVLNSTAALVAAVAYAYIPYHLVDLYVRAAQAELVSFVFPPLIFWAFHQLAATRRTRYAPLAAFSYAGLILSHVTIALLFTPIIGLYLAFIFFSELRRSPRTAFRFALIATLAIALALSLASIFLLPVLFEQRYLTSEPLIGEFFNYRKHFLSVSQLLSPTWGYGYAGEQGNNQFSLQLGLVPTLLAILALFTLPSTRGAIRAHIALFMILTLTVIFAMLSSAAPLWEPLAPVIGFIQFPWRLLIVTTFTLAFLCGAALYAFPDTRNELSSTLAVIFILVLASYNFTLPQHTDALFNNETLMEFQVKYRELLGDTVWTVGERPQTSPLVEQYLRGAGLERAVALDDHARVATIRNGGNSSDLRVQATAPARILVQTRYFPGWSASANGTPLPIEPYGDQGLILVRVPEGSHVLQLQFHDTPIRQIGALISGAGILVALAWLYRARVL